MKLIKILYQLDPDPLFDFGVRITDHSEKFTITIGNVLGLGPTVRREELLHEAQGKLA